MLWTGFLAEFPAHTLKMVGNDGGDATPGGWWYLEGSCSGDGMTEIHFDFSPKGGPADLLGAWAAAPARTEARWRSVGDGRCRLALSSGLSGRLAIVSKRARALGAACRTPRAASAARVLGSTRAARNHVMS